MKRFFKHLLILISITTLVIPEQQAWNWSWRPLVPQRRLVALLGAITLGLGSAVWYYAWRVCTEQRAAPKKKNAPSSRVRSIATQQIVSRSDQQPHIANVSAISDERVEVEACRAAALTSWESYSQVLRFMKDKETLCEDEVALLTDARFAACESLNVFGKVLKKFVETRKAFVTDARFERMLTSLDVFRRDVADKPKPVADNLKDAERAVAILEGSH